MIFYGILYLLIHRSRRLFHVPKWKEREKERERRSERERAQRWKMGNQLFVKGIILPKSSKCP